MLLFIFFFFFSSLLLLLFLLLVFVPPPVFFNLPTLDIDNAFLLALSACVPETIKNACGNFERSSPISSLKISNDKLGHSCENACKQSYAVASYSISSEAPSWEFSGGRHTFGLSSCFCCVFVGFCCAPSPPAIIIASSSSSSSSSSPSEADESVTSSPTTVYPPSSSSSSSELLFFSSSSSLPFFFFFLDTKFDGNRGIISILYIYSNHQY